MNELSVYPVQDVPMVGVFHSQARADEAIQALKDANFAEDQIFVTDYQGVREDHNRVIVHVLAAGREQEAVGLLVHHGANNSDLPPGTEMVNGDLILRDPAALSELSQQPTVVESDALPPAPDITEHRG